MSRSFLIRLMLPMALALAIFAWAGSAETAPPLQPQIPHTLEGRIGRCLECHGPGGLKPVPADHAGRTNDMCLSCHQPTLLSAATATPTAEPAPAASPTATPAPVVNPAESSCVNCHSGLTGALSAVVADWNLSIHSQNGVGCNSCHGGDPTSSDQSQAMSVQAGFKGVPAKMDIPALCGSCHANVSLMRQFNLPTDQLAQYQQSQHGQLLAQGDGNVATCFDCHGGHAIRAKNDPKSSIYVVNVPATCAGCHANTAIMSSYGIPTDQYDAYKDSVHGVKLLRELDPRAPNCATCHGTHGATPPGIQEVRNVCGQCHSATRDLYGKSPHAQNAPGLPQCITCHGNHGISKPGEELFIGAAPGRCGACHDPSTTAGSKVKSIYDDLHSADLSIQEATSTVDDAALQRMLVGEERENLQQANSSLILARAVQHTSDPAQVKQNTDDAIAKARQARQSAQSKIGETIFRREAMVVVLVLIGLVMVALWLIRRELFRSASP